MFLKCTMQVMLSSQNTLVSAFMQYVSIDSISLGRPIITSSFLCRTKTKGVKYSLNSVTCYLHTVVLVHTFPKI